MNAPNDATAGETYDDHAVACGGTAERPPTPGARARNFVCWASEAIWNYPGTSPAADSPRSTCATVAASAGSH